MYLSQHLYAMSWEIKGEAHLASFEMRHAGIENKTLIIGMRTTLGRREFYKPQKLRSQPLEPREDLAAQRRTSTPIHTETYSATAVQAPKGYVIATGRAG